MVITLSKGPLLPRSLWSDKSSKLTCSCSFFKQQSSLILCNMCSYVHLPFSVYLFPYLPFSLSQFINTEISQQFKGLIYTFMFTVSNNGLQCIYLFTFIKKMSTNFKISQELPQNDSQNRRHKWSMTNMKQISLSHISMIGSKRL